MISSHTLSLNHCQLSSHLPHYLRLGILEQADDLPALWPIAWDKPFLLQYSAVDSQVAYDIIEYWSLQIMLQAPVSKLQTVLFDSGLQQAFATLEQIRLQTEYQAVVTISDAKGQAEYLRELATVGIGNNTKKRLKVPNRAYSVLSVMCHNFCRMTNSAIC